MQFYTSMLRACIHIVAIAILISSTAFGVVGAQNSILSPFVGGDALGSAMGGLIGFLIAYLIVSFIFGVIALLFEIRDNLADISQVISKLGTSIQTPPLC